MIVTFPKIETTLQKGIALGVLFELRHTNVLRKINEAVGMVLRRHTEKDIEGVFASRNIPKRKCDVISGVES